MRFLVVAFTIGFAASIVIIAITAIVWVFMGPDGWHAFGPEGETYTGTMRNAKTGHTEKIYKLVLPRDDSALDPDVKEGFKAHVAWKHKEKDFWFALAVKDFGMAKPRNAEMVRDGIDRLEKYFGTDLELGEKAEPVQFGTLSAQKLAFRGVIREAKWLGECYMFFKDGFAYWLFIGSPDETVVERFAQELPEKHVFVISDRRGWREQPPVMDTFTSLNGKVVMTGPKEVWKKGNALDEDETGQLLLTGIYRGTRTTARTPICSSSRWRKRTSCKTRSKRCVPISTARRRMKMKTTRSSALPPTRRLARPTTALSKTSARNGDTASI